LLKFFGKFIGGKGWKQVGCINLHGGLFKIVLGGRQYVLAVPHIEMVWYIRLDKVVF